MDDLPAIVIAAAIASAAYVLSHDFHYSSSAEGGQPGVHKIAGALKGCLVPTPGVVCGSTHR